jgi:hypothetical protein
MEWLMELVPFLAFWMARVAQKQAVPIMKILQKKELVFWQHDKLKNTWTSQQEYM